MPNLSGQLATILVMTGLLTGCQPPTPAPTPTPSYRCTPEAGGAQFDCTPHQHNEMVTKDKLYAEAEAVYRKFFAEDVRLLRVGGATEPTQALLETATGAFLDDSMDYYRSLSKERTRLVGGEIDLVSLSRVPGISKENSVVVLRACIDASTTLMETNGKPAGPGRSGVDVLYFGRPDGRLMIQGADGTEAKAC